MAGRRYTDVHASMGNEFQATDTASGSSVFQEPDVAFGTQGRMLVVTVGTDASGKGIIAQQLNSNGSRSGPELILNQETDGDQDTPTVVGNNGDNFLLAWRGGDRPTDIFGLEYTLQNILEPEIAVTDSVDSATDLTINFGEFSTGDQAVTQQIVIQNEGNADLMINSVAITGPGAAQFLLNDTAGFTLTVSFR